MPVAPATVMSLAIWVSFWMLMSFRSVMLRPGGRPLCGDGFGISAGGACSAAAVLSGCALARVASVALPAVSSGSLAVRAGAGRLCWVGMGMLRKRRLTTAR